MRLAAAFWRYPDQFWRHVLVARLLRAQDSVLDVGGVPGGLAPLLPGAQVMVANVAPPADVVFDGERLPFGDGAFAAVASLDVLEHVPPARRAAHLGELLRVARERVVLCCPLGTPEHEPLERELDAWRREATGTADPFLSEHLAHGLPTEAELRALAAQAEPQWRAMLRFHGDSGGAAALFRAATLAGHRTSLADRARYALRRVRAAVPGRLEREARPETNRAYLVLVRTRTR